MTWFVAAVGGNIMRIGWVEGWGGVFLVLYVPTELLVVFCFRSDSHQFIFPSKPLNVCMERLGVIILCIGAPIDLNFIA